MEEGGRRRREGGGREERQRREKGGGGRREGGGTEEGEGWRVVGVSVLLLLFILKINKKTKPAHRMTSH